MYKIGFVGSHSTGKTVLAKLVEAELIRRSDIEVQRINEGATNAKGNDLPINEETTVSSQLWILHSWCAEDILYSSSKIGRPQYDVLLSDRGPENYCYLENKFGENKYALNIVLGHLELYPYNKFYRLPIVKDAIMDNGVRSRDPVFRRIMDEKIVQFLDKYQIQYTNLPIPEDHDHFRDIWARTVVNDTLRVLGKSEEYHMRE